MSIDFILNDLGKKRSILKIMDETIFNTGFLTDAIWPNNDSYLFVRTSGAANLVYQSDDFYRIVLDRRWFEYVHLLNRIMTNYYTIECHAKKDNDEESLSLLENFKLIYSGLVIAYQSELLTCGSDTDIKRASTAVTIYEKELFFFREYQKLMLADNEFDHKSVLKNILALYGATHEWGHIREEQSYSSVQNIDKFTSITWDYLINSLRKILKERHHIKFVSETSVFSHLISIGDSSYDEEVSVFASMLQGLQDETSANEIFADCFMAESVCINIIPILDSAYKEWSKEDVDSFLASSIFQYVEINNMLTALSAEGAISYFQDPHEARLRISDVVHQTTARLNILQLFVEYIVEQLRGRDQPNAVIRSRVNETRKFMDSLFFTLNNSFRESKKTYRLSEQLNAAEYYRCLPASRSENINLVLTRTGFFDI